MHFCIVCYNISFFISNFVDLICYYYYFLLYNIALVFPWSVDNLAILFKTLWHSGRTGTRMHIFLSLCSWCQKHRACIGGKDHFLRGIHWCICVYKRLSKSWCGCFTYKKLNLILHNAPMYFLSLSKQSYPWIFSFSVSISVSSKVLK